MWNINIKKPRAKAKLQGTPIGPTSGKNVNPSPIKKTNTNFKIDIIFLIIFIVGDLEFLFLFKKSTFLWRRNIF